MAPSSPVFVQERSPPTRLKPSSSGPSEQAPARAGRRPALIAKILADAVTGRLALTVKEAAAALGVGKDAIYKAINRGDLRAVKLGGRLLVPQIELNRMLGVDGEPEPMAIAALLREVVQALGPGLPDQSRISR